MSCNKLTTSNKFGTIEVINDIAIVISFWRIHDESICRKSYLKITPENHNLRLWLKIIPSFVLSDRFTTKITAAADKPSNRSTQKDAKPEKKITIEIGPFMKCTLKKQTQSGL